MRLRVGTRRGGAVFSVITSLIFYGVWTLLAFGAVSYFASEEDAPNFLPVLAGALLFITLYWQLAPVISAGFGASLDLRKLMVYPIPHRKLFTVEVLLRLTNCAEMLVVLAGVWIGLLRNPAFTGPGKLLATGGALLFVATNLLFSAGARHLLERLFLRTRLREGAVLLLVLLGLLPQILLFLNVRKASLIRLAPRQLLWPWAAAARLMLHDQVALSAGLSLAWLGLALWFGRRQFERSFREDPSTPQRARPSESKTGFVDRLIRFPSRFLTDPIGAMVEKELRTLLRIPRFRMVYAMSCFFGIVLYLPALRNPRPQSFATQNALPFMALYGLLMLGPISYWNAFGFDRSAVQGYFSWPIRFRDALIAKNLTVGLLLIPQTCLIALAGKAVRLPALPAKILEAVIVILISSLYWFAMGNIFSVRMPRPMDPGKMNQMANKMQALSIWTAPLLLLPVALAYWARAVFENELVFAGILVIAAGVGGIFYKVALDSCAEAVARTREAMLMQLSRSEGPISLT